jgi:hypothetical protein
MARDDLVTPEEIGCPACGMFGCDCDAPEPRRHEPKPCPACHRARVNGICQCATQVPQAAPTRQDVEELMATAVTWKDKVEACRQTFRHHWHDTRDAAEIERMIVDMATRLYRP